MQFSDFKNFISPTKEEVDKALNRNPHQFILIGHVAKMIYVQINEHGLCEPTGMLTGSAIYCKKTEQPTLTK